jgi:hypothetical protein
MVTRLSDARLNDVALVAEPLFGAAQDESQLSHVMAAAIAEFHALQVVPDALVRIQLRGVPGQLLQVQALGGALTQEVFDRLAAMDGRAIPNDQQLATDCAQQDAQEADDIGRAVGVVLGLQEEAPGSGDAAAGREVVVGQRHPQHRRLPTGCPGAHRQGQQVAARVVYPDAGAPLVGRFFSRAGQRSRHQAWIAAASRWVACCTGRWTLWRTACSRRLTWAGW